MIILLYLYHMETTTNTNTNDMNNLEINAKLDIIETVEDLKFQRNSIIEIIKIEGANVKKVMTQMLGICQSSNFSTLDETTTDFVYRAIDDVNRMTGYTAFDMGEINRMNAIENMKY